MTLKTAYKSGDKEKCLHCHLMAVYDGEVWRHMYPPPFEHKAIVPLLVFSEAEFKADAEQPKIYAGLDIDGKAKLYRFTHKTYERPYLIDHNEWLRILDRLSCEPGEMPLVQLSRDLPTEAPKNIEAAKLIVNSDNVRKGDISDVDAADLHEFFDEIPFMFQIADMGGEKLDEVEDPNFNTYGTVLVGYDLNDQYGFSIASICTGGQEARPRDVAISKLIVAAFQAASVIDVREVIAGLNLAAATAGLADLGGPVVEVEGPKLEGEPGFNKLTWFQEEQTMSEEDWAYCLERVENHFGTKALEAKGWAIGKIQTAPVANHWLKADDEERKLYAHYKDLAREWMTNPHPSTQARTFAMTEAVQLIIPLIEKCEVLGPWSSVPVPTGKSDDAALSEALDRVGDAEQVAREQRIIADDDMTKSDLRYVVSLRKDVKNWAYYVRWLGNNGQGGSNCKTKKNALEKALKHVPNEIVFELLLNDRPQGFFKRDRLATKGYRAT